jgi:arylsulfatase A-like enzyme
MLIFLRTEGFLENSFLFFLSDHGSRVDKIRNTPIGRLEERLPLLSLVVPEHLKQQFPNLHKSMFNKSSSANFIKFT